MEKRGVPAKKTPSISPKIVRNMRGMMKMKPQTIYHTIESKMVVTIITLATVIPYALDRCVLVPNPTHTKIIMIIRILGLVYT
jgi:hypothetical protein